MATAVMGFWVGWKREAGHFLLRRQCIGLGARVQAVYVMDISTGMDDITSSSSWKQSSKP